MSRNDFGHLAFVFTGILTNEEFAVCKEAWRQPGALTGMLNYYRAADAGPPDPERGRPEGNFTSGLPPESLTVHAPTLVIWGEQSVLPITLLDGLDDYVADLSVITVPGAGHWLPEERPDEVNRLIRQFLPD